MSLLDLLMPLAENLRLLVLGPLLAGCAALGITYLMAPTFTGTTSFMAPQQQQGVGAAAMASLGALAGLAGGTLPAQRTPADQCVALMQSTTVSDRIIDRFQLMQVYGMEFRDDARKTLAKHVRFTIGKKDGLIVVEADDKSPQRAADLANAFVDELRRMNDTIAVTEAQQRRVFFEQQLEATQQKLVKAQQALQSSGVTQGALKVEPKAAAENYARLKAEATAAEVRLQSMRRSLADGSAEVQQQQAAVSALRDQLARLERSTDVQGGPDYVGKYREFKYQETLFELYARQFELARVDESREGALIQVVDPALAPEHKSKPKRAVVAVVTTLLVGVVLLAFVAMRHAWRRAKHDPNNAARVARLRAALRLKSA